MLLRYILDRTLSVVKYFGSFKFWFKPFLTLGASKYHQWTFNTTQNLCPRSWFWISPGTAWLCYSHCDPTTQPPRIEIYCSPLGPKQNNRTLTTCPLESILQNGYEIHRQVTPNIKHQETVSPSGNCFPFQRLQPCSPCTTEICCQAITNVQHLLWQLKRNTSKTPGIQKDPLFLQRYPASPHEKIILQLPNTDPKKVQNGPPASRLRPSTQ